MKATCKTLQVGAPGEATGLSQLFHHVVAGDVASWWISVHEAALIIKASAEQSPVLLQGNVARLPRVADVVLGSIGHKLTRTISALITGGHAAMRDNLATRGHLSDYCPCSSLTPAQAISGVPSQPHSHLAVHLCAAGGY